jgi:gliding motility-associated-like protein
MSYKKIIYILFLLIYTTVTSQPINIDDKRTPEQLIIDDLINSPCLIISSINGSGNPTGSGNSYASFTSESSNFPFKKGVILSTSASKNAVGPFGRENMYGEINPEWKGDDDLNKAISFSGSTQATVLEFDFVALTNSLSFNYIFASNEYVGSFACFYSDGIAFLIKKADSEEPYKNFAVIPGTNEHVSATNIRPEIMYNDTNSCKPKNEIYFNGYNSFGYPINYSGQTKVMNARTELIPGEKYHLKLVIADDRTGQYNSAVFIESGSLTPTIDLGKNRMIADVVPACFGETVFLDTELSESYLFQWFKDGTAISGANSSTYTATSSGKYTVNVKIPNSSCNLNGGIDVDISDDVLYTNTPLYQCDVNNDGFATYNLTKVDGVVKRNVEEILNQGYYETMSDALAKTNPIKTPEKYSNKTINQIVFARIENKYGCYKIAEVKLQISNEYISDLPPITLCDTDENQDGIHEFNLNLDLTPKITEGLPAGMIAEYYYSMEDAFAETNQISNIFRNQTPFTQIIFARFVNGGSCYVIKPITLLINTFSVTDFNDETKFLCKNGTLDLGLTSDFSEYLWNTGSEERSITVDETGDYTVTVRNESGCERTKVFRVVWSEPAVITGAVIKDLSGIDNTVTIQYAGIGNYEFSLDETVFQDNAVFDNVVAGKYTVVARDKNGCGLSNTYQFLVLDYPRFFTPNGDGFNDTWRIKNLDLFSSFEVLIFDRYGKLLKQINQNYVEWDGKYNGQELASDDYWFTLVYDETNKVSGHFSLKR